MVNIAKLFRWIIFVVAFVVALLAAFWCITDAMPIWGFVAAACLYVAAGAGVVDRLGG